MLYAQGYSVRQIASMTGMARETLRRGFLSKRYPPLRTMAAWWAWAMLKVRVMTTWLHRISKAMDWHTVREPFAISCSINAETISLDAASWGDRSWHDVELSTAKTPLELLMEKEESYG
jgi:lambda repressor-like predicted transcriptional regulator